MRRFVLRALAVIAALVAIAVIGTYLSMRRSLPTFDGTASVSGISAPIDIVRDADAIPHIFAATKLDALFGLGYAHAQDRLWQMEFQRRIGHGRLSEIFGAVTLPQDRFLRTVGFGRAARAAWEGTPEWAKQQVNAYVSGVNAFLSSHHGTDLPLEFSLLRFEPEAWSGPDVIVWIKMMAWDLSSNYSLELLRHDLVRAVGVERMAALMPPYARNGLSILGGSSKPTIPEDTAETVEKSKKDLAAVSTVSSAVESSWSGTFAAGLSQGPRAVRDLLIGSGTAEALGSNNWVVDGTRTASGKPLLANDPHLAAHVPSTWYLAHMSAPDFDVIGATVPGAPAVALGRNRSIAWGATNVAADVEDLYRERLDGAGTAVEFQGAMTPVTIVPETIVIRGALPVQLSVRATRHGPLVSDAINATNAGLVVPAGGPKPQPVEPLAFRWTALDADDTTIASFLELNDARNWNQFTQALRSFVVPAQNFVYADVDGHIGYYAPGRIPIRASGDGSRPSEGWSGDAEWTGWVPFDELPHLYDPPTHVIVTANHRPAPADYRYHLGLEWPEPYRAQRITDLLQSGAKLTPDDFARIQADTVSLHAKTLLPLLLSHAHPQSGPDRRAADLLRQWNADAAAGSAAQAIFEEWFYQLISVLVVDELGPLVTENYRSRFSFATRFLVKTLTDPKSAAWCDNVKTPRVETCDEAVTVALGRGVADLTRRLGGDMASWRWDAVHPAVFPHSGLDSQAALRPLLSRSVPNGGDWSTVNVGPIDVDHPFEQHTVAGYREIIDLSPAN
ncbi:MAG TPA: penicillin acylase family protein, partial [Vicinamibacterales bacterium]|nr:penicillin acylase family protein [Vicinamibacterales bacterium]